MRFLFRLPIEKIIEKVIAAIAYLCYVVSGKNTELSRSGVLGARDHSSKDQTITVENSKNFRFQTICKCELAVSFFESERIFSEVYQDYSAIASPLYEAAYKNCGPIKVGKRRSEKVILELNKKGKAALGRFKGCLTTTTFKNPDAGVLMMPNFAKEFVLYTDDCHEGFEAVLCLEDAEKKNRPVEFYSRKLKASETKYVIEAEELIAIKFAMEH